VSDSRIANVDPAHGPLSCWLASQQRRACRPTVSLQSAVADALLRYHL